MKYSDWNWGVIEFVGEYGKCEFGVYLVISLVGGVKAFGVWSKIT